MVLASLCVTVYNFNLDPIVLTTHFLISPFSGTFTYFDIFRAFYLKLKIKLRPTTLLDLAKD